MVWFSAAALWLIPVFAGLLFWRYFYKPQKNPGLAVSLNLRNLKSYSFKNYLYDLPRVLMGLAILLMIVALARPRQAQSKVQKSVDGIDIVFALDISDSMLIEDMEPRTRLEAAKATIENFIKRRQNDRLGLVIFAGESFTVVPPTLDTQLILERLADITTAQEARIKDGTAIGVGLANACGRLKDSKAKSRVVIFLTDGENNSGTIDPETGIDIAKQMDIKIYSIGIGKSGPTRIPIIQRDAFGRKVKIYQPFDSTINEDLLQKMARETGGKFYRADSEKMFTEIFDDIDQLEKTKIDVQKYTLYDEKYLIWLWSAVVLYLAGMFLGQTILRRKP